VGDDLEHHGPILSAVASSGKGFAEPPLDHAEGRFHLPALSVTTSLGRALKVDSHDPAEPARGELLGWAACGGWDDGANAQIQASEGVDPLGVVTGVGQQALERMALEGFGQRLAKMKMIGPGTSSGDCGEHQMGGAVGDDGEFRKAFIGQVLWLLGAARPAADEVVTDLVCGEAARVDGRFCPAAAEDAGGGGEAYRLIQEAMGGFFLSSRSAAFCSVVQWGTSSSSMTWHSSGASISRWPTPR